MKSVQLFDNLPGVIRRTVVNNDNFINALAKSLIQDALQGVLQVISPVAGWYNDR